MKGNTCTSTQYHSKLSCLRGNMREMKMENMLQYLSIKVRLKCFKMTPRRESRKCISFNKPERGENVWHVLQAGEEESNKMVTREVVKCGGAKPSDYVAFFLPSGMFTYFFLVLVTERKRRRGIIPFWHEYAYMRMLFGGVGEARILL